MKHPTEEELILHRYGEAPNFWEIARHLEACPGCRAEWRSLQRALEAAEIAPVPERGGNYGAEVWRRIEGRIELPTTPGRIGGNVFWERIDALLHTPRFVWGAATVALVLAAFLAGRLADPARRSSPAPRTAIRQDPNLPMAHDARERILVAEIGEHLERGQMALIELVNSRTNGPVDLSLEKEMARQLVVVNRLYRQTAARLGDVAAASVLDDLERALIEISNSPDAMSEAEFAEFRRRIDSGGVLFEVRVFASHLPGRMGKTEG